MVAPGGLGRPTCSPFCLPAELPLPSQTVPMIFGALFGALEARCSCACVRREHVHVSACACAWRCVRMLGCVHARVGRLGSILGRLGCRLGPPNRAPAHTGLIFWKIDVFEKKPATYRVCMCILACACACVPVCARVCAQGGVFLVEDRRTARPQSLLRRPTRRGGDVGVLDCRIERAQALVAEDFGHKYCQCLIAWS